MPPERITGLISLTRGAVSPQIQAAIDAATSSEGTLKNYIIDPDYSQFPEGTVAVSITSGPTGTYGPALWAFRENEMDDYAADMEQSDERPSSENGGSTFFVDITTPENVAITSEIGLFEYKVTGSDYAELHGKEVTFGFWHKHIDAVATHTVYFQNSAEDRSYVTNYTQAVSDTWEFTEITLTLDTLGTWLFTDADIGLRIGFASVVGPNVVQTADSWQTDKSYAANVITMAGDLKFFRPRLYLGPSATTFFSPLQATTEDLVDWYIQRYNFEVENFELIATGLVLFNGTGEFDASFPFRNKIRATPIGASTAAGTFNASDGPISAAVTSISVVPSKNSARLDCIGNTSMTQGNAVLFRRNSTNTTFLQFDARHYS